MSFSRRCAAVLFGCITGVSAKESTPPKVMETFEVGANVVVRSLAIEEAAGALWVGTSAGVLEVDLKSRAVRSTFTREHGLANEYVFAIGIDSQGYKWFGTNAGGVSRYRNGQWKTYFPMHGLADYWVYSFAERGKGEFWVGTWAGVTRVDLARLKFTNYVKELINEWVYGIAVDARSRVWFGTEGGISMLEGDQWRHWSHKDGLGAPNVANLPNSTNTGLGTRSRHDLSTQVEGQESYNPNYVFAIHAAPDGTVWAGTWGGGVARFDGKVWRNYTTRDGLAGNVVYSIAQEPGGAMWFGTNHGLSRFDGSRWTTFGKGQGLTGNDVYAIEATRSGEVWVGTKGGVSRIAAH
ncbi:MAG: regulator [Betaproteobacteria bacterium]|nr:regulator [Betaproteobacteria bacterium]